MQMQETPQQVMLEPQQPAEYCVIWMHGLGADGYDFIAVAQHMARQMDCSKVRFIFPHATIQPVTMAAGESMRSWYDILSASPRRVVDPAQLLTSVKRIQALIQEQVDSGIDSRHIALVGFSQGGAVAYETASMSQLPLAALAALSTYIPLGHSHDPFNMTAANNQLPIFIGHGNRDGVVPAQLGEEAMKRLSGHGSQPQWHSYPMQHEVCVAEINDLCDFLQHAWQA
ncbi:alpha/beta hydrolase [Oceanobacter mangrovi]|uniref:alpha/beta hydrolase n=1 Tax=Oceanobacter mangrovi TaxID=2862510 RepID=UPI001C8E0AEC|nr:dienelactone hydrolase family protein [Oceanobacter mangrovi]